MPSASLRALLHDLIDYAGLYPPAALPMSETALNYAAYGQSSYAWALGRIVVPVARLGELAATAQNGDLEHPWKISAICGDDPARDAAEIEVFMRTAQRTMVVDAVEVRAGTAEAITRLAGVFRRAFTVYVEIPLRQEPAPLLDVVARERLRAKIRTGGVTPDAFPNAEQVARFLDRCSERKVAFKATAGLHHPLTGDYRVTYAPDAARGQMFGFLNVFLAAAFAQTGMLEPPLVKLLQERAPSNFVFLDDVVAWCGHSLDIDRISAARTSFAIAFGSCSFTEPIDDLRALGLLR